MKVYKLFYLLKSENYLLVNILNIHIYNYYLLVNNNNLKLDFII
jgi:hypothetical protein